MQGNRLDVVSLVVGEQSALLSIFRQFHLGFDMKLYETRALNHLPYNIAIYIAHNIWNIIIVDSCSIHFETTRVTLYVEFPVFLQD